MPGRSPFFQSGFGAGSSKLTFPTLFIHRVVPQREPTFVLVSIQPLPCPQRLPSLPISVRNWPESTAWTQPHHRGRIRFRAEIVHIEREQADYRVNNDLEDLELQVWKSFMSKSFVTHGPACFIGFKFYLQQLKKCEGSMPIDKFSSS